MSAARKVQTMHIICVDTGIIWLVFSVPFGTDGLNNKLNGVDQNYPFKTMNTGRLVIAFSYF